MKPTISNAFQNEPVGKGTNGESESTSNKRPVGIGKSGSPSGSPSGPAESAANPRKSLASSLSAMQADLSEAEFGWSLELTPMRAIDAVHALGDSLKNRKVCFLVTLEQSAWLDGKDETAAVTIAQRLAIPVIASFSQHQLLLEGQSLEHLTALCQPSRLLVVAIEGDAGSIEAADVAAINRALEGGASPLLVEVRAVAALEVLGDRAVVLHAREREIALAEVAENFRHYLAAMCQRPAAQFAAPFTWQMERLLGISGALTVRPIETDAFSTLIDVGINTSRERAQRPADRSLIYDIPSNTWHDEP